MAGAGRVKPGGRGNGPFRDMAKEAEGTAGTEGATTCVPARKDGQLETTHHSLLLAVQQPALAAHLVAAHSAPRPAAPQGRAP